MRGFASFVAALCVAAPALAEERLALPVPDGFALAQTMESETITIRDYMPAGQTGENWQEMLSVQAYAGLELFDPQRSLSGLAEEASLGCSGLSADLETHGVHALPMAVTVMTCPAGAVSLETETLVTGVLEGEAGLYVIQAAWRGELEQEPLQRWIELMLHAQLCQSDLEASCEAS